MPVVGSAETYANTAKGRLTSHFELRGALELSTELLMPTCPELYRTEDGKRPVRMVDEHGLVVGNCLEDLETRLKSPPKGSVAV